MERDVVCGMQVDPAKAAGHTDHEGRTFYFCSKGCLQKFQSDPKKYLDPAYRPGMHAMPAAPAPLTLVKHRPAPPGPSHHAGHLHEANRRGESHEGRRGESLDSPIAPTSPDQREYTCPMHPEVRQRGPGSCTICGMALEPVETSLEEEPNHELIDMTRRFWWSV